MAQNIKVKMVKSKIGQSKSHKANLQGLGLTRMNQEKTLENTACVRGMIRKVQHLVEVREA